MRSLLPIVLAAVLAFQAVGFAQPSPATSTCVLSGQTLSCQYRFRADGLLDVLTATVTLLDAVGAPVLGWPTTCTLVGVPPNPFCSCCPNPQTGVTGPGGVIVYTWRKLGGRGFLEVVVSAAPAPVVFTLPVPFTSPDLNGSCEPAPASSVTVIDLALMASCLPPAPYCTRNDFNCNGVVNIIDVAIWSGGLGKGCASPCP